MKFSIFSKILGNWRGPEEEATVGGFVFEDLKVLPFDCESLLSIPVINQNSIEW